MPLPHYEEKEKKKRKKERKLRKETAIHLINSYAWKPRALQESEVEAKLKFI